MNKQIFFFFKKFGTGNILGLISIVLIHSIFEVIGIASIFPLLKFLVNPDFVNNIEITTIKNFIEKISFESRIFIFLIFFGLLFFLRSLISLYKIWFNSNLFYRLQVKWSDELLNKYLSKPYLFHKSKNSSDLIRNISEEVTRLMNSSLIPLILIISDLILVIPIIILLVYLNYEYVILISSVLIFTSFVTLSFISPFLKKWGKLRTFHSATRYKSLIQSLSNVKDILLIKKQNYFTKLFTIENKIVSKANRNSAVLSSVPKIFLELILFSALVLFIAFNVIKENDLEDIIPIAGVFFAAAMRLLPTSSNILKKIQLYKYGRATLELMYTEFKSKDYLQNKKTSFKKINFLNHILLKKISFNYDDKKNKNMIFFDINLKIKKGDFVGIKGKSGSGKSTLMDIMLGLVEPTKGQVFIDKYDLKKNMAEWHNIISHIPQEIVLLDESIKNNIALGENMNEINKFRLNNAILESRLQEFVNKLPKKTNTIVGERGSKISGGERQRIGIARALYRNSKVLFFDETTSNLDKKTEIEFLKGISKIKKNKTIIMISHSDTALKYCDKIYELKKGKILKIK